MQIILLESIRNVGRLGDMVRVAPGFGRNFLIPQGKAVSATPANIKKFEARRAELEQKVAQDRAAAQARADKLANKSITLKAHVGEEGKLFGSIGVQNIVDGIQEQLGQSVEKREVDLSVAIKECGEYNITLELYEDVRPTIKLIVTE